MNLIALKERLEGLASTETGKSLPHTCKKIDELLRIIADNTNANITNARDMTEQNRRELTLITSSIAKDITESSYGDRYRFCKDRIKPEVIISQNIIEQIAKYKSTIEIIVDGLFDKPNKRNEKIVRNKFTVEEMLVSIEKLNELSDQNKCELDKLIDEMKNDLVEGIKESEAEIELKRVNDDIAEATIKTEKKAQMDALESRLKMFDDLITDENYRLKKLFEEQNSSDCWSGLSNSCQKIGVSFDIKPSECSDRLNSSIQRLEHRLKMLDEIRLEEKERLKKLVDELDYMNSITKHNLLLRKLFVGEEGYEFICGKDFGKNLVKNAASREIYVCILKSSEIGVLNSKDIIPDKLLYSKTHSDGWTISANPCIDWGDSECIWIDDFTASHDTYGTIYGNMDKKIRTEHPDAFEHFIKYHPIEELNMYRS
jgi:hypothetical protein